MEIVTAKLFKRFGVNNDNSSIFTSGIDFAILPENGTDESFLVLGVGANTFVAAPLVDLSVGSTRIGVALVISGDTGEGGSRVRSEQTFVLLSLIVLVVLQVLNTSRPKLS